MKLHLISLLLCITLAGLNLISAQMTPTQLTLVGVTVWFVNNGTHTQFNVTSPLGNGVSTSNSWLGVGMNTKWKMVT